MIKHIVMWKFKDGEEENMKKFLEGSTYKFCMCYLKDLKLLKNDKKVLTNKNI